MVDSRLESHPFCSYWTLIWKQLSGSHLNQREVMEIVWMQVKATCEKLKEETNAQDEHIRKMLKEMADCYYS